MYALWLALHRPDSWKAAPRFSQPVADFRFVSTARTKQCTAKSTSSVSKATRPNRFQLLEA